MRLVFGLVFLIGIGLAGFAVYLAKDYISVYQSELATERAANAQMVETRSVFVLVRSIRYGERLFEKDLREVRWPVNAIPEGSFGSMEEIFPDGLDIQRTVLRAMEKSEAVLAIKVTEPGEDAGVSSRLGRGMRAFAIRVDVASGVSGFLRPGDRVDIYWTGRNVDPNNPASTGELTQLIEASVKILAIDQIADSDRNNPTIARTITVEITPRQVATLAQATATGRLTLSLVGAEDDGIADSVEIDSSTLLGRTERAATVATIDRICTVRTRKGAEIIETPIACPTDN
jgi:pilus assembly protein CpaB